MPDDFETLTAGLRQWTATHDPHVRAAVELLIWHETWLRRMDFVSAAVESDGDAAYISWPDAREFCGKVGRASTSELAILDLAVALGENRYRLSVMGNAHARAIADAVAAACAVDRG